MSENSKKETKVINNSPWKDRHQFVLSANGNIVCQRYFRVNGFNPKSLRSAELLYTIRDAVNLIKKDLESKSRVYTGITQKKTCKLRGFYEGETLSMEDAIMAYSDDVRGEIQLSNGTVLKKDYVDYPDEEEEVDNAPFTLSFRYLFDEKVIYEETWDGSVYPKYVRNCIDLSNNNYSYRNTDPMYMTYSQNMSKNLNEGRADLIRVIIGMFCVTLSDEVDDEGQVFERKYTFGEKYGKRTYMYSIDNREVNSKWEKATLKKTLAYNKWLEGGITDKLAERINNM